VESPLRRSAARCGGDESDLNRSRAAFTPSPRSRAEPLRMFPICSSRCRVASLIRSCASPATRGLAELCCRVNQRGELRLPPANRPTGKRSLYSYALPSFTAPALHGFVKPRSGTASPRLAVSAAAVAAILAYQLNSTRNEKQETAKRVRRARARQSFLAHALQPESPTPWESLATI
jgi:hypothetical protein